MSKLTVFPDLAAAREEAALWVARMDRGLSAAEQAQLREWLRNPANRRAFEELGQLWEKLDVMSVLADLFPRVAAQRTRSRVWIAAGALAASVLAAVLLLRLVPLPGAPPAAPAAPLAADFDTFSTAVGEHRSITLRDGSLLSLNTDTVVDARIAGDQRSLVLRRGEAHFEVAHDAARPFTVTAGNHAVRAVGTAFNIRLRSGNTADVLVTSGIVRVSPTSTRSDAIATVTAGQLLELRGDGTRRQRQLDAAAVESLLAWRRSVIIFDGETLAEAIQEIGRYTSRHIRLADAQLGRRRVVGYFPSNDLQLFLNALQANFGLQVTESGAEIVLSASRERAAPE